MGPFTSLITYLSSILDFFVYCPLIVWAESLVAPARRHTIPQGQMLCHMSVYPRTAPSTRLITKQPPQISVALAYNKHPQIFVVEQS